MPVFPHRRKHTYQNQRPRCLSRSPGRSPAAVSRSAPDRASDAITGDTSRETYPGGRFPFRRWKADTLESNGSGYRSQMVSKEESRSYIHCGIYGNAGRSRAGIRVPTKSATRYMTICSPKNILQYECFWDSLPWRCIAYSSSP